MSSYINHRSPTNGMWVKIQIKKKNLKKTNLKISAIEHTFLMIFFKKVVIYQVSVSLILKVTFVNSGCSIGESNFFLNQVRSACI